MPNLNDLTWDGGPRHDLMEFASCTLFLSPTVTTLRLRLTARQPPVAIAACALALEVLPQLRDLHLERPQTDHSNLDVGLFSNIVCLQNLRTLCLPSISTATIPDIAALPRLESLTIERLDTGFPWSGPYVGRFNSLKQLSVCHSDEEGAAFLLHHLSTQNILETLRINMPFKHQLQQLINFVAQRVSPHTFTTLSLTAHEHDDDDDDDDDDEEEEHTDAVDDLEPSEDLDISGLLRFTKLKSIHIRPHKHSLELTPLDVKLIIDAWKDLETLDLGGEERCERGTPLLDQTHILHLLEGLPHLEDLRVHFDASRITGEESSIKAPFPLRRLCVGDSPIRSPSRVVRFMKTAFVDGRLSLNIARRLPLHRLSSNRLSIHERRWMEVRGV